MATQPATHTGPVLERRKAERRELRKNQLQKALRKLDARHQEERRALAQELRELAVGRKAIQDQLWTDWINSSFPDLGPERHKLTPEQQRELSAKLPRADRCVHVVKHHLDGEREQAVDSRLATVVELGEEDAALKVKYLQKLGLEGNRRSSQQANGASSAALSGKGELGEGDEENGKEEGPGEGDEKNPYWVESVLKASQKRDEKKQALFKEFLPAKNELHVEVQHLLEVLDKEQLQKAYEHRIETEDSHELIKARQQTEAARRAGLWRFVSKKRLESRSDWEDTAQGEINYVDKKRLGYPKLPASYEEIKNLLDIEKNPIFSKALQEWNRKEEWYNRRVERKKNRVASLKNEVYQLIGFFSVFQGVVLTAVSQSSFLFCHNKWSPIALSVLASVISTIGVIQKLQQINDLQGNIDVEERAFTTAVQVGQRLQELGPKGIDFVDLDAEIERNNNRKSKLSRKRHLAWVYFVLVILTLVAFGVLFPISFWRILCKPAKMGKTTLVNNAGFDVQVREGNSNIMRNIGVLAQGKTMTIEADSTATYREYVLVLLPDNEKLRPLTSDDIQEFQAVEIYQVKEGEYNWRELRGWTEKKSWFGSFLGWFSPKSGAKANANVEASAGSSESSTVPQ